MTSARAGPIDVAVLGGGMAGLTAAYELTRPGLKGRYRVTVYQQGWRLGGKGASGRFGPHARIQEHGLHLWFGFYVNALALMGECAGELASLRPENPYRTLADLFQPVNELVFADADEAVCLSMPPGEVGEPFFERLPLYVVAGLSALAVMLGPLADEHEGGSANDDGDGGVPSFGVLAAAARQALLSAPDPAIYARIAAGLEQEATTIVEPSAAGRRMLRQLLFFWAAVFRGLGSDVLCAPAGTSHPFDRLNEVELRIWLGKHGQLGEFVDAPFLRALYDLVFAYPEGQVAGGGELAAGVAVENLLSMVGRHRGPMLLKMRGAMGDVIFAPLYEVLLARGVRFNFFHAVRQLSFDEDGVSRIAIVRQLELLNGEYDRRDGRYELHGLGYDPLEPYDDIRDGLRCWPAEPRRPQVGLQSRAKIAVQPGLIDFEREADPLSGAPVSLERGVDFDVVVLAMPVATLGWLSHECESEPARSADYSGPCSDLMLSSAAFRSMVLDARPVMTQSLQLWLDRDRDEIGWPCRSSWFRRLRGRSDETVLGNAPKPFDTMCDMTHLVELERWGSVAEPKQIAYFCGVFDHGSAPNGWREADEVAKSHALRFLREHQSRSNKPFWMRFQPDDLHDPGGGKGWARLDAQHWRANVGRSERYSAPFIAAVCSRLAPGESGLPNLVFAGDWTRTQVNAGCVEAAVMSGMLAAAAVVGDEAELRMPQLPSWRTQVRAAT